MSYWKGVMIAAAIDLVWIMGSPTLAPNSPPRMHQYKEEITGPPNEVDELHVISLALDSLMLHLQESPEDVDAIEKVAAIYSDKGWWDAAIGPLARAIQLNPERRRLWSALDRAVEKAGMATITDAELTVRAQNFVEAVAMWGHGC